MVFSYAARRLPKHFLRCKKVFPRLLHVAVSPLQCSGYVDHNVGLSIYSLAHASRRANGIPSFAGGIRASGVTSCATAPIVQRLPVAAIADIGKKTRLTELVRAAPSQPC